METQLDEINSVRERLEDGELRLKKELQEVKLELTQTAETRDQLRADKEQLERELASKTELVKSQEEVHVRVHCTYMVVLIHVCTLFYFART